MTNGIDPGMYGKQALVSNPAPDSRPIEPRLDKLGMRNDSPLPCRQRRHANFGPSVTTGVTRGTKFGHAPTMPGDPLRVSEECD